MQLAIFGRLYIGQRKAVLVILAFTDKYVYLNNPFIIKICGSEEARLLFTNSPKTLERRGGVLAGCSVGLAGYVK